MTLPAGQTLGPYEIVESLGKGGMGEVYRARDPRLGREVALKILPSALADNEEALGRFEREARAVAALSHPNILAIYDFGSEDGLTFAVTELLEGETLRDRIEQPLNPHKALAWAVQIARGLAAAHSRGIVHRDLKPANIFVTRDGIVKILDFGLARDLAPEQLSDAPTLTRYDGEKIYGTLGYMAPEQACGEPVGPSADVFSFGVVLYEMLTGRRAFLRSTFAESLSATLRDEPPFEELDARAPQAARVIRHCLEKRPEERYQSAHDLAFHLTALADSPERMSAAGASLQASGLDATVAAGSALSPARLRRTLKTQRVSAKTLLVGGAAGLLLGLLIGFAVSPGPQEPPPRDVYVPPPKVRQLTFSGADRAPAVSPDGRLLAFASTRDGRSRIWLKQLGSGSEAPLTEGVDDLPRFSPDGSSVLFIREMEGSSALYRVDLLDVRPRMILDQVSEADWAPDGRGVAFLRGMPGGEEVVGLANADGGEQRILATAPQLRLKGIRYSPDGRRLVVSEGARSNTSPEVGFLLIDVADGSTRQVQLPGTGRISRPAWSRDDALIYAMSETLLGDMQHTLSKIVERTMDGDERILFWAEDLFVRANTATLSLTDDRRLFFDRATLRQNLFLAAPNGDEQRRTAGMSRDRQPIFSPDGETVVFSSDRSGNLDLWKLHLPTGESTQITDDAAADWDPAFTDDGARILWSSDRGGHLEVWTARLDGSGAQQLSRDGKNAENPTATPDGEHIVYCSVNASHMGLWRIRRDGSEATHIAEGLYVLPEVSPDGRYVLTLAPQGRLNSEIRVFDLVREEFTDFAVPVYYRRVAKSWTVALGRSRWMPDGGAIAYLDQDDDGRVGVFVQDFSPNRDTSASRRPLAGFARDSVTESFGVHPDGERVALSRQTIEFSLMFAEQIADSEVDSGEQL